MFERLALVDARYREIEALLADGSIYETPDVAAKLLKEQKDMQCVVDSYREYLLAKNDFDEAQSWLKSDDVDMRNMAYEEIESAKEKIEIITEQIKVFLLPKDEDDDKDVLIEIRGGVGGEEAALFANSLYRMYCMYAERNKYVVDVLNTNETELGGIKEISFSIVGKGAWAKFKYESGAHRVQRVPETESSGRVHTSAVTVAVLPEAEEVEIDINPTDLQIDTYRSGGAGGQHVNKTESAIRITHIPTGVVVECQDERSQHKNKDRAMKILRTRLYEAKKMESDSERAADRRSQVGTGDRSERIRTYNYPQGRVTDHRISLTLYKLDAFLNGDMDEMLNALSSAAQAEKLQNAQ